MKSNTSVLLQYWIFLWICVLDLKNTSQLCWCFFTAKIWPCKNIGFKKWVAAHKLWVQPACVLLQHGAFLWIYVRNFPFFLLKQIITYSGIIHQYIHYIYRERNTKRLEIQNDIPQNACSAVLTNVFYLLKLLNVIFGIYQ